MSDGNKTNLIVNYLPQTLTDDEFRSMFTAIGSVRASKIIRDRATGYSYGFGFVDYMSADDAAKAIGELNGLQVQNKTIKVAFSRNHDEAKGGNVYVRNLPRDMNQQQLEELFTGCGEIVNCRILSDQFTGLSKGVGFVLFDKKTHAEAAIAKFNNFVPPNGTEALNVKFAEENAGKARGPANMAAYGYGGGAENGGGGPMRNQGMGNRYRYSPMGGPMGGPYGGGPYGAGRSSVPPQVNPMVSYTLFAYNVGLDATEATMWDLFSPFGTVQKIDIIRDASKNNQCKGFCFVTMPNYHEAANAVNALNGYTYKQKPLQISFKK